jgi:hypothetical protein
MAVQFTLGTANEQIEVTILGFEDSSAENESVVKWLDSTVSVKIGVFSGSFTARFTTHDLWGLYERLSNALISPPSSVAFKNTGGDLSLSIEFNELGRATVTGAIQPSRSPQGILHFRFDVAQSDLVATTQELHDALQQFPIHKSPRSAG